MKLLKVVFLVFLILMGAFLKAQNSQLISGVYHLDSIAAKQPAGAAEKPKLLGGTTDLTQLSFHSSTLAPGKTNHPLRALLDREELIIVKDGQLTLTVNGSRKLLSTGSIALIVAGDEQSFSNASDKPASYYVLGFKSTLPVNISRGKDSGGSIMKDWAELSAKKTIKGESRPVFDRASSMFERFEVHATNLNASQESHPAHSHRAEEIMLLLKGEVTMHIGQENYKALSGSLIFVTPNVVHNLTNTGSEPCSYYAIKWYNEGVK